MGLSKKQLKYVTNKGNQFLDFRFSDASVFTDIEDWINNVTIHPYIERGVVFFLFFYLFYNFLSFSYYPLSYTIFLIISISLLSLKFRYFALVLGILSLFPIIIFQELFFSFFFMIVSSFIIVFSGEDWKIGYIIFFSLLLAMKTTYSFSMLVILIYSYIYGTRKGAISSFFFSLLAISFGYGSNATHISLFILPNNNHPYLLTWKGIVEHVSLDTLISFENNAFESSAFIQSVIVLFTYYPHTLIQVGTCTLAGYLSGNIKQWIIKYSEIISLPIASLPIFLGSFFTEIFLNISPSRISALFPPFFIVAAMFSLFTPYLSLFLNRRDLISIKYVAPPSSVTRQPEQMSQDMKALNLEGRYRSNQMMIAKKFALIIANDQYDDDNLRELEAPELDADALAKVLGDPGTCNFLVQFLVNKKSHEIEQAIETFFKDRTRNDLLLLYFSGHGLKDEEGKLYFATPDTRRNRLMSTAVSASFVNDLMRRTRSRCQVLLLDCCFSGAFARGMIAKSGSAVGSSIGANEYFQGRGRVVLTASDAMQYAFEEDELVEEGTVNSVFTSAIVDGIKSWKADKDKDDRISITELYDYVDSYVHERTPNQRPSMWSFETQGEIIIAEREYIPEDEEEEV